MTAKMNRKQRRRRSTLSKKIERTVAESWVEPYYDREDPDLLSYVNEFLLEHSNFPPLEQVSLLTREGALRAIEIIQTAQERVRGQERTVKALKALIAQKSEYRD